MGGCVAASSAVVFFGWRITRTNLFGQDPVMHTTKQLREALRQDTSLCVAMVQSVCEREAETERLAQFLSKLPHGSAEVSPADVLAIASCVALEEVGGPSVRPRLGRKSDKATTPEGGKELLLTPSLSISEQVALRGGSGTLRVGATATPGMFNNEYFEVLLSGEGKWKKKKGGVWYFTQVASQENDTKKRLLTFTMTNADTALLHDALMKGWVEVFSHDEANFYNIFREGYRKVLDSGYDQRSLWEQ